MYVELKDQGANQAIVAIVALLTEGGFFERGVYLN